MNKDKDKKVYYSPTRKMLIGIGSFFLIIIIAILFYVHYAFIQFDLYKYEEGLRATKSMTGRELQEYLQKYFYE